MSQQTDGGFVRLGRQPQQYAPSTNGEMRNLPVEEPVQRTYEPLKLFENTETVTKVILAVSTCVAVLGLLFRDQPIPIGVLLFVVIAPYLWFFIKWIASWTAQPKVTAIFCVILSICVWFWGFYQGIQTQRHITESSAQADQ